MNPDDASSRARVAPPDEPVLARPTIDVADVRRLFESARPADDFVARETARRMTERLASIRVDATRVLDVGCGDGADAAALGERFPGAVVHGVDLAFARLRRMRPARTGVARWLRRAPGSLSVQADLAALPFASQTFDVVWSNLALHWHAEPHRVLPEWARTMRTGGLVAFSAFGPDTLREVAAAFAGLGGAPHVVPFTDMHDYGDMLVAAGFATPVVDVERLALTYATAASLWADVRALGGNPVRRASRALRGRRDRARLDAQLDALRDRNGRYALTFELVYAHAWKGEPVRTRAGEAIVRVTRPSS